MSNGADQRAIAVVSTEVAEFQRYERRRLKAAIALTTIWVATITLHLVTWGQWVAYGLTVAVGSHLLRLLWAKPRSLPAELPSWRDMTLTERQTLDPKHWPLVSILVAAKNEATVIERLAHSLMTIDYPPQRLDVWLIDDHSTDGTSDRMDALAAEYEHLQVVHRSADAVGGKSGALNEVWPQTRGSLLLVFDADAQVSSDCLRQLVPMFYQSSIGAVQLRKAIANDTQNFWTRSQVAEMAFDAYCQLKRVTDGGIGELRGNGQCVRRAALESCGGWNEETITDDLDLTLKLHLTGWDIAHMMRPVVWEEGVVNAIPLWHQRNRWAEGGYQRYLDYWQLLTPGRLGWRKAYDLFIFWVIQYVLPTAALPDFAMAVTRSRLPILMPVSSAAIVFATLGMASGLWRTQQASPLSIWVQTLRGITYMTHWFVVVGSVTLRMALRPKRLKWIKTQHGAPSTDESSVIKAQIPS
jgi:1,2-diacylglycerol 3-beta-glucosyltransferase